VVVPGYPHHGTQRALVVSRVERGTGGCRRSSAIVREGRFASVVMDEPHLMAAARYVERNPVWARLARRGEEWRWSSAGLHVRGKPDPLAESAWLTERTAGWVCFWGEFLREDDAPELAEALRQRERTGRPLGEEPFLRKIGRLLIQLGTVTYYVVAPARGAGRTGSCHGSRGSSFRDVRITSLREGLGVTTCSPATGIAAGNWRCLRAA